MVLLEKQTMLIQRFYDKHDAFEIDKTKMKMLVPLDMNNKAITNVGNLSYTGLISIFGSITRIGNENFFITQNIKIEFRSIKPVWIRIYTSHNNRGKADVLIIGGRGFRVSRYPFRHSSIGYAQIQINKFFDQISSIKLANAYNLAFHLTYELFY